MTKYSGSRNFIEEHVSNHIWEDPVGTVLKIEIVEENLVRVTKDEE